MRVPEGDVRALVANAVRYRHDREAHLYEQAHMAMAQVVHADSLDASGFAAAVHLVVEVGLREPE